METETTPNTPIVRAVGVIDENKNFIPYGSTAVAKGIPVFVFNTKAEYDEHAPTLPEPCVVITLDDIDTGGFEFDSELSDTSENAVQNKVIKAALEALKEKASFTTPGMVQFTDATTITDKNSGYALSAIEKNASVEGSLANGIQSAINLAGKIKIHKETTNVQFTNGRARFSTNLAEHGFSRVIGIFANLVATDDTCSVSITNANINNYGVVLEITRLQDGITKQVWITYIGE